MNSYDIVIVGGGLIGTAMALALSDHQLKIALVDDKPASTISNSSSLDMRNTALSQSSIESLQRLGVWQVLRAGAAAIQHLDVSYQGRLGTMTITPDMLSQDFLGYVVENHCFSSCLQKHCAMTSVQCYQPWSLNTIAYQSDCAVLTIQSEEQRQQLSAKLIIGADGTFSKVRQCVGLALQEKNYQQAAMVTNLILKGASERQAWERFTKDGPQALLPLGQQKFALVATGSQNHLDALKTGSLSDFQAWWHQTWGFRLGEVVEVGTRQLWPMIRRYAPHVYTKRCVLVGNAAQTVHPVAAQGFNLGLRDVMTLAHHIGSQSGNDVGDYALLERYAHDRSFDRNKVIFGTDKVLSIFGTDNPLLKRINSMGLKVFDRIPSLKQRFLSLASSKNIYG